MGNDRVFGWADPNVNVASVFAFVTSATKTTEGLAGGAEAADAIASYGEALAVDSLILRVQWPGLEQTDTLANIERIGSVIAKLT